MEFACDSSTETEINMDRLAISEDKQLGCVQNGHGDKNGNGSLNRDLTKKREDYLNWPDYFMGVAFLSAMRSKDPCTQVIIQG